MNNRYLGVVFALLALSACGKKDSSNDTCVAEFQSVANTEIGVVPTSTRAGEIAQSFKATKASGVTTVQLQLKKNGFASNTSDYVNLKITAKDDTTGDPSGTALGTSANVLVSSISSSGGYVTFTFASSVSLTQGTTYWLRLTPSYGLSTTDYISWKAFNTSSAYTDGVAKYNLANNTASWSNSEIGSLIDLNFRLGCPSSLAGSTLDEE